MISSDKAGVQFPDSEIFFALLVVESELNSFLFHKARSKRKRDNKMLGLGRRQHASGSVISV
jgi:hypothetical protein